MRDILLHHLRAAVWSGVRVRVDRKLAVVRRSAQVHVRERGDVSPQGARTDGQPIPGDRRGCPDVPRHGHVLRAEHRADIPGVPDVRVAADAHRTDVHRLDDGARRREPLHRRVSPPGGAAALHQAQRSDGDRDHGERRRCLQHPALLRVPLRDGELDGDGR